MAFNVYILSPTVKILEVLNEGGSYFVIDGNGPIFMAENGNIA